MTLSRRQLLQASAGVLGYAALPVFARTDKATLVVVGGGFGGATAARTLKTLMPRARVTLVEPKSAYIACPFSNLVVAGQRSLKEQAFDYRGLESAGIRVARTTATDIQAGRVKLATGAELKADRVIISPGISMDYASLAGYDESAVKTMPHAWQAGEQTRLLRGQLRAMPDNGVVLMSIPPAPYRCPPGPYERASLIAGFLAANKPGAKLLLLDGNDKFSKQPLFEAAWKEYYGDIIEWRGASDFGAVQRVDVAAMTLYTDFDAERGDVVNVIPPQMAGRIAQRIGAADATGWCPIDATTFESTRVAGVHIIGDATIAAPMPKSAFSANAQAKVCAIQVARSLADLPPEATTLANTCYSYTTPDTAISVSGVYTNTGGRFANVPGAAGTSPFNAPAGLRAREALQAADWFRAITREAFAA